jgi:clan AA aspartic protease
MAQGFMRDASEAILPIDVSGKSGAIITLDAIVDTGFSEFLTLPSALIDELELTRTTLVTIRLADGSRRTANVYKGSVRIEDLWLEIGIEESEGDIILGMGLLRNCQVCIEVAEGGVVTVESLN